MTFVLIDHAHDGTQTKVRTTAAAALGALAAMIGGTTDNWTGPPLRVGHPYHSEWGNRLVVEERPAGHTARTEDLLRDAFDGRERGTATAQQLTLRRKHAR
jgi:hypothetical protein